MAKLLVLVGFSRSLSRYTQAPLDMLDFLVVPLRKYYVTERELQASPSCLLDWTIPKYNASRIVTKESLEASRSAVGRHRALDALSNYDSSLVSDPL